MATTWIMVKIQSSLKVHKYGHRGFPSPIMENGLLGFPLGFPVHGFLNILWMESPKDTQEMITTIPVLWLEIQRWVVSPLI